MARRTNAQRRQQELAWLLFQLRGARGNLRQQLMTQVPDAILRRVQALRDEMLEIDKLVQACLSHDANLRAQSFRRSPAIHKKVSP